LRELETGAQQTLAAGHFAVIYLVIIAGEVQETVEDEHLDLSGKRMALLGGLTERRGYADSQVTGDLFRSWAGICALGGKRQNVCGFVLAAEPGVELANGRICAAARKRARVRAEGKRRFFFVAGDPDAEARFAEVAFDLG